MANESAELSRTAEAEHSVSFARHLIDEHDQPSTSSPTSSALGLLPRSSPPISVSSTNTAPKKAPAKKRKRTSNLTGEKKSKKKKVTKAVTDAALPLLPRPIRWSQLHRSMRHSTSLR